MKITSLLAMLLLGVALARAQTNSIPLKVGDSVPDVTLRTEEDKEINLRKLMAEKPTVLVFFHGSWCPFCNGHLQSLTEIEEELNKTGGQIFAISLDQPGKLKAMPDREKIHCRLFSDPDAVAAKAFGIVFKIDDVTLEKCKEYGISMEAASGSDPHNQLHPTVFVANTNGVIRFAYVNPDYKVRLEPKKILEAAQAAGR